MLIQAKGFCKIELAMWEISKGLLAGGEVEVGGGGFLLQEASTPLPVWSPKPNPEVVIELSTSHFVDDA